jgi:hypothetical protein
MVHSATTRRYGLRAVNRSRNRRGTGQLRLKDDQRGTPTPGENPRSPTNDAIVPTSQFAAIGFDVKPGNK